METKDRPIPLVGEEGSLLDQACAKARSAVRAAIEEAVKDELGRALGGERYEHGERRGYRNGTKPRRLTTSFGIADVEVPRARLFGPEGTRSEWQSRVVPRYRRRSAAVDAAILSCYLTGVNTRKVKAALRPLLGNAPLSRSVVSRVTARLKEQFEQWRVRPLQGETFAYLMLDGFGVKVRLGGKVVSVPILGVMGVREDGQKVVLALELCGSEAAASWEAVVRGLVARGLKAPILAIVDGHPGLLKALGEEWPGTQIQRCTVHKLRNLLAHAPMHLRAEVAEDFHAFVYAETPEEVKAGYERFLRKWEKRCPGVAASLREAGEDLLTFLKFPKSQWRSLRTTNPLERLNGEFRRRVKTQSSFPSPESVPVLLYALVATGLVRIRKIGGWSEMPMVLLAHGRQAA